MAGIYFHYPFCSQACNYCNFHFSTQTKYRQQMQQAMKSELYLRKSELKTPIESIYFGGGSPSLLPASFFHKVIKSVNDCFKLGNDIEITLEANPNDLTLQNLKDLKKSGVNRISIGVQSFHDYELKMMNRIHNSNQGLKAIEWTSKVFDNFSVDLIYGLPKSNISTWAHNLDILTSFNPPHISSYALTVEPKTVLFRQVDKGDIKLLDEEAVQLQYDLLTSRLEKEAYINYEFSNFGKIGFHSVNNSNYWNGKPYLGIGPSAHSYDGHRVRSWNISNNLKYLKSIENGCLSQRKEVLKDHEVFNEYVMIGLRTDGVKIKRINESFGSNYGLYLEKQAKNHLLDRRLFWDGDVLKVSRQARFLSDGIASDLFMLKS
ncbi:MAG: radical SAM family heme chaperone HemW [Flavobacteriaceae bacterium TMED121]|nr:MAG: radical SAM family heme chaperone HemW [Flavobacteriaceae bacterium TMED121]|tara:strand:- start:2338 stop:3465 length:1128 start_codon:yes stop_codon:yes gene_type:complete